jgi:hypothetical protein
MRFRRAVLLERWRESDFAPLAAIGCESACEEVTKVLSREESDERAAQLAAHFAKHGFQL